MVDANTRTGGVDVRKMNFGDVVYRKPVSSSESSEEKYGSVSVALGQVFQFAGEGWGFKPVDSDADGDRVGMLCFNMEGCRHMAAYGAQGGFYVLTQEDLDNGSQGRYFGKDLGDGLLPEHVVDVASSALGRIDRRENGCAARDVDWGAVKSGLKGMAPAA